MAIKLVNEEADRIKLQLVVYYNATVLDEYGQNKNGQQPVNEAVQSVITNLPFNGVYRNSDLLAAIMAVQGVEVADIIRVETKTANAGSYTQVIGFDKPYSGYYAIESLNISYKSYDVLLNPKAE